MTNNEIKIVIAESQGWIQEWFEGLDGENFSEPFRELRWYKDRIWESKGPPDYPEDLNAMHEVEKTLRENQFHFVNYLQELWGVVNPNVKYTGSLGYLGFEYISATARQRAEAYLRVKGMWK